MRLQQSQPVGFPASAVAIPEAVIPKLEAAMDKLLATERIVLDAARARVRICPLRDSLERLRDSQNVNRVGGGATGFSRPTRGPSDVPGFLDPGSRCHRLSRGGLRSIFGVMQSVTELHFQGEFVG